MGQPPTCPPQPPLDDSPAGAPPPAAYPSFYLQAIGPSCSGLAYAPPGVLLPGGPYPGYPDSNGAQPATAPYPPSPPAAYPSFAALPSQPGYPPPQSLQPPPQAQPSYSGALIQPQPTPGLRILPPLAPPLPGQVVVAWEQAKGALSGGGILALLMLLIFCWPCFFIPLLMEDCYETVQRPVYGYPCQAAQQGAGPPPYLPLGVPVVPCR